MLEEHRFPALGGVVDLAGVVEVAVDFAVGADRREPRLCVDVCQKMIRCIGAQGRPRLVYPQ